MSNKDGFISYAIGLLILTWYYDIRVLAVGLILLGIVAPIIPKNRYHP